MVYSNSSSISVYIIEGLVVSEEHAGNGKRELVVQTTGSKNQSSSSVVVVAAAAAEVTVLLDGTTTNTNASGTSKWFTVKKARNLIYSGVGLRVSGNTCISQEGDNTKTFIHAKSLDIISVHPSKQYLARLFSFSLMDLNILFSASQTKEHNSESNCHSLPTNFLQACAPVSQDKVQQVYDFCQAERMAGRGATLWKTPDIEELSTHLFEYLQSGNALIRTKPKNLGLPKVSQETLEAVRRLEHLYVRPLDGPMDEYIFDQMKQCYFTKSITINSNSNSNNDLSLPGEEETIHYGDFDPCHNLPNPEDERRLKYVDERKRPQVKNMLQLIQKLVKKRPKKVIQAVDIGGGRGYFGIAAAGTFPETMHVTVVDNNEPSLEAGRACAKAAGLDDNLEFVHCDLSDTADVENLLRHNSFDIVFGLHCCGGLAEAAVELAIKCKADFCVSTCCFRSLPHLASLTRLAEQSMMAQRQKRDDNQSMDDDDDDDEGLCQYKKDVSRVATLAVLVGGTDQHCAIRAYNSMRLVAAESRVESLQSGFILQTWQETFPVEYSVQNRVLMGTITPQ